MNIAIVQLARAGDIVSILPACKYLHDQGNRVDLYIHEEFAKVAERCSYVNLCKWTGTHRDVPIVAKHLRDSGAYDEVIAAQVDGNLEPAPEGFSENFIQQQWARVKMTAKFHDLPLVFDRDKQNDVVYEEYIKPRLDRPIIALNMSSFSSPFCREFPKRDDSELIFLDWIRRTFGAKAQLFDISAIRFPHPLDLLTVLRHAKVLVSVDSLPIHLAYATSTPTVVLSRPSVWYMSEPRRHWIAHEDYRSWSTEDGRKNIQSAIEGVLNGAIKIPDKGKGLLGRDIGLADKRCRVIHVADWYTSSRPDDQARMDNANISWRRLEQHDKKWFTFWFDEKTRQRTSKTIGCDRSLSFLKDAIDYGCEQASNDDIIVFTNADSGLPAEASGIIRRHMQKHDIGWCRRVDVRALRQYTMREMASGVVHCGADLFAFKKQFWIKNRKQIPDFLLGAEGWDFCLRHWMNRHDPASNIHPIVWHVDHRPQWAHEHQRSRSQEYNRRLCTEWALANGLQNALLPPTSKFLFRIDGTFETNRTQPEPRSESTPVVSHSAG